jgi:hypothetical protein
MLASCKRGYFEQSIFGGVISQRSNAAAVAINIFDVRFSCAKRSLPPVLVEP